MLIRWFLLAQCLAAFFIVAASRFDRMAVEPGSVWARLEPVVMPIGVLSASVIPLWPVALIVILICRAGRESNVPLILLAEAGLMIVSIYGALPLAM